MKNFIKISALFAASTLLMSASALAHTLTEDKVYSESTIYNEDLNVSSKVNVVNGAYPVGENPVELKATGLNIEKSATFTNEELLSVLGDIEISGTFTNGSIVDGESNVDATTTGTTLKVVAKYNPDDGSSVTGRVVNNGKILVTTVNVGRDSFEDSQNAVQTYNARITNNGVIEAAENVTVMGIFTNAGTLTTKSSIVNGTLNNSGSLSADDITVNGTLSNSGTLLAGTIMVSETGTLKMQNTGEFDDDGNAIPSSVLLKDGGLLSVAGTLEPVSRTVVELDENAVGGNATFVLSGTSKGAIEVGESVTTTLENVQAGMIAGALTLNGDSLTIVLSDLVTVTEEQVDPENPDVKEVSVSKEVGERLVNIGTVITGTLTMANPTTLSVIVPEEIEGETEVTGTVAGEKTRADLYTVKLAGGLAGEFSAVSNSENGYDWLYDEKSEYLFVRNQETESVKITIDGNDDPGAIGILKAKDIAVLTANYANNIVGAGTVSVEADVTYSGNATEHSGKTIIAEEKTLTMSGTLGTGAFIVNEGAELNLNNGTKLADADGTATTVDKPLPVNNLISGAGKLTVTGNFYEFTQTVNTQFVDIAGTVCGNFSVGSNCEEINITGNVVLDVEDGEKVSYGNAKVIINNGANLCYRDETDAKADAYIDATAVNVYYIWDLIANNNANKVLLPTAAELATLTTPVAPVNQYTNAYKLTSRLASGDRVTLFEGTGEIVFKNGNNEYSTLNKEVVNSEKLRNEVRAFLKGNGLGQADILEAFDDVYAIVFDFDNGFGVQVLNENAISKKLLAVSSHGGLSSAFVDRYRSLALKLEPGIVSYDNIKAADPLLEALFKNPNSAGQMLEVLSPLSYSAMAAMPTQQFYADMKSVSDRIKHRKMGVPAQEGWTSFAQYQYSSQDNDDDSDTQTYDTTTSGILAGAEYRFDQTSTAGVALGVDYGKAKIHHGGGKIEMNDIRVTAFATKTGENGTFATAGASIGRASFDAKRQTVYGDPAATTSALSIGAFIDVGIQYEMNQDWTLAPFINLAYAYTNVEAFDESGSSDDFKIDSFDETSLRLGVGATANYATRAGEKPLNIGITVAYTHDFLAEDTDISATDSVGNAFSVTGQTLSVDVLTLGVRAGLELNKDFEVYAGYSLNAGTDSSLAQVLNVGLNVKF